MKVHPLAQGRGEGDLTMEYNGGIFMSTFPNDIHGHRGFIYKRPGVPKKEF